MLNLISEAIYKDWLNYDIIFLNSLLFFAVAQKIIF